MIAALGVEGDVLRERAEKPLRPRAGGDHHPVRGDAPSRADHLEQPGKAIPDGLHLRVEQAPAPLHERPGEPVHHGVRIAEVEHVLHVDPAVHHVGEGRLQIVDLARIELPGGDPVGAPPLAVPVVAPPALLRFVDVESTGGAEERLDSRSAREGKEALLRPVKDRGEGAHRRPHPTRAAGGEEAQRPGQEPGQIGPLDRQRAPRVEEHGRGIDDPPGGVDRNARVGGEDARVPVRRSPAGGTAVDQGDLVPRLLQPEGGGDADHAGPDHHHPLAPRAFLHQSTSRHSGLRPTGAPGAPPRGTTADPPSRLHLYSHASPHGAHRRNGRHGRPSAPRCPAGRRDSGEADFR